jgi:hypothetical protein
MKLLCLDDAELTQLYFFRQFTRVAFFIIPTISRNKFKTEIANAKL